MTMTSDLNDDEQTAAMIRESAKEAIASLQKIAGSAKKVTELRPWEKAFPMVSAEEMLAPVGSVDWLCQGLRLAPGFPTMVAGYGYSGKTLALQDAALSIASGKDVWGLFSCRRGKVIHLDYDQGKRTSIQRYQRIAFARGIDLGELVGGGWLRLSSVPAAYLTDRNAEKLLVGMLRGHALCIIDSFTSGYPGVDEIDKRSAEHLYLLGRVSELTGCTIVVVHHARKDDGATEDKKNLVRGSGALFGACSVVWVLFGARGKPVQWSCIKERHEGSEPDDFWVQFRNEASGTDPRAGVRVVHLDKEQVTRSNDSDASQRRVREWAQFVERVLELVKVNPGSSGNKLYELAPKATRQKFQAALRELSDTGRAVFDAPENNSQVQLWRAV